MKKMVKKKKKKNVSMLPVKYVLRWPNIAPTHWPYGGPTSKLTLGQRNFTTLPQQSD